MLAELLEEEVDEVVGPASFRKCLTEFATTFWARLMSASRPNEVGVLLAQEQLTQRGVNDFLEQILSGGRHRCADTNPEVIHMGLRTRTIAAARHSWGAKMAAASAALISVALFVPSPAVAQESSLDEIYAALRPENLRTTTGGTAFSQGDSLEFLLELVNTSDQPLVIPLTNFFGSSFHLVGTQQAWIERLGSDPTIPSIPPIIGRKGTWYASGGSIIAVEGLPGNTIPPGGRVTRQASVFYSTAGFPSGRYRFHVEYKPLFGGLFDVIAEVSLDLTIGAIDTTPPVITLPADITVDATASDGATVAYSASATDDVDGPVPVTCAPLSGSTFAIGTTTVVCLARDGSGNGASASFQMHVKGASEQLDDLLALVAGVGPGSSLADKIADTRGALASGHSREACEKLAALANEAEAQSGKKLTSEQATQLVAAANRIRAVLAC